MEYLLGSLATIVTIAIVLYSIRLINSKRSAVTKIFYSQSNIYERIKPAIPFLPPKPKETQSINHLKKQMVRIVIIGSTAYWIFENSVFQAPIAEDGTVDYQSALPIDTMGMNKVELDKLSFIVEKLTEGNDDDRSNSGYKNL